MIGVSKQLKFTLALTIICLFALSAFAQNRPSEQKTGSVLVFPYYTSNIDGTADTFMSISNANSIGVNVHLYFLEGRTCSQADVSVYLTPNATISFRATDIFPAETGYLIAVAVDGNGGLIANGGLTGNAFVKLPPNYLNGAPDEVRGNYGAWAFNAYQNVPAVGGELALNFNGAVLDAMPSQFAVAIQAPSSAPGQTVVLAGMSGNINGGTVTGASQSGTGGAYNADEAFRSFTGLFVGGCMSVTLLSNSNPRLVGTNGFGLSGLIYPGSLGTLRFSIGGGVGLLITPRNSSGWHGIRNLPFTRTTSVTLVVPSF